MKIYHNDKELCAIGLMSGTSFDGVDTAIIVSDGKKKITLSKGLTLEYPPRLKKRLKEVKNLNLENLIILEDDITRLHVKAVNQLLKQEHLSSNDINVIGFHGQTVLHMPQNHLTWQLGNPSLLSFETKIDVISDFRRKDLAAKGFGAPLVPVFHHALATNFTKPVAFLNIGGVANLTYIGENEQLIAFDTGPGNAPIDDFVNKNLDIKYDEGGKIANMGRVHYQIINNFLNTEYFSTTPPKAIDRESFNYNFLDNLSIEDGVATLSMMIALSVKAGIELLPTKPRKLFVCGGGRKNVFIMNALQEELKIPVKGAEDIIIKKQSLNPDLVEAYAFGYLAIRTLKGLPITFSSTTGCKHSPISKFNEGTLQGLTGGILCKYK